MESSPLNLGPKGWLQLGLCELCFALAPMNFFRCDMFSCSCGSHSLSTDIEPVQDVVDPVHSSFLGFG